MAARRGDKDCFQFLLEAGADILAINNAGENALQCAAQNLIDEDSGECLMVLVNRTSDILKVIKSSMDAGDTELTRLVPDVPVVKPLPSAAGNERKGSDVLFQANDEQMHFEASRGSYTQLPPISTSLLLID